MNKERINIYTLKNLLRADISLYTDKVKEKDNNSYLLDMYKEIIDLIDNGNPEELMENSASINLLLQLVYNEEVANKLTETIYKLAYAISKYSKMADNEKNLLQTEAKLNKIIRKILDEYDVIYNKNEVYIKEINNKSKRVYYEKGILYRLNTKKYLENFQIEEIKKILKEHNINNNDQIIVLEYVRNHNIKCSYSNPRVSYTTINMLQAEFTLYDIEGLIDIELKNKLDNHVVTIFENLFLEETEKIEEYVNDYTIWMNKEEYDYTMQSILNRFLIEMKNCQTEMLNNYDDVELRKIVIEDYNHYYYKYIKFKKYYEEKMKDVTDGINEEIIDNDNEENNLFYLMCGDISYIEKDIEDVPEEYLDRVKKLLEGFKNNTLQERFIEGFTANGKLKGYKKLKDDQVRIVFRKINNNNYLILGIFVKKENRATKEYVNIVKRDYDYNIDDELIYSDKLSESDIIYDNLMNYIDSNSRKGNR